MTNPLSDAKERKAYRAYVRDAKYERTVYSLGEDSFIAGAKWRAAAGTEHRSDVKPQECTCAKTNWAQCDVHAFVASTGNTEEIERCERCNWPIVPEGEAGCWKSNCSFRPMPPLPSPAKPATDTPISEEKTLDNIVDAMGDYLDLVRSRRKHSCLENMVGDAEYKKLKGMYEAMHLTAQSDRGTEKLVKALKVIRELARSNLAIYQRGLTMRVIFDEADSALAFDQPLSRDEGGM